MTSNGKTPREKALELIANLSRISLENGSAQEEVETAGKAIQRLMQTWQVEWGEIYDTESKRRKATFEGMSSEYTAPQFLLWHWKLADIVGMVTGTRYWLGITKDGKNQTMHFYGDPSSVRVAASLYAQWASILWDLSVIREKEYAAALAAKIGVKSVYSLRGLGSRHPFIYRNSWLIGCLDAMYLTHRLDQYEAEKGAGGSAIVLYREELDRRYEDVTKNFSKSEPGKRDQTNQTGYRIGVQDGKKIKIGLKTLEEKND